PGDRPDALAEHRLDPTPQIAVRGLSGQRRAVAPHAVGVGNDGVLADGFTGPDAQEALRSAAPPGDGLRLDVPPDPHCHRRGDGVRHIAVMPWRELSATVRVEEGQPVVL